MLKNIIRILPLVMASLGVSAQTPGWGTAFVPAGANAAAARAAADPLSFGTNSPGMIPPGMNAPGINAPSMNAPSAAPLSAPAAAPESQLRPPAARAQPNQFQRFVQDATGRSLPIYGGELFSQPQAYAPDTALPAPANYVLGVGDELRVQVWGAVDYVGSHVIDRQGQISLPRVGVVMLAGVPLQELESVLRARLSRVFTNFSLSASMGRLRAIQVYVVGQAQQPGTYQLSSLSTLINAVFASGGPNANGSMRNIQLRRGGQTITTLDLYEFIGKGDKGRDVSLQTGDVIVMAPAGPRVALTGAMDQSAIYELKPGGSTVGEIVGQAGGLPALADPRKALLERILSDRTPPRQVLDITLDALGLQTALRDGDVLTVLPVSPAFANAVTLQGTVAQSLRYRWFEGMRLLDLLPEREALITPGYHSRKNLLVQNLQTLAAGGKLIERVRGLADEINWDYAVIERMDKERLSTQVLPFNLGRLVLQKDAAQNLPLQPGDVVTIFSNTDLRLPVNRRTRLVRLEGEVAAPGIYQSEPGETIAQLIARVGGLTPQAYLFGTEFTRESVRQRQQENLDALVRRLEAQAQSQATGQAANATGDRAAQVQATLAAQQAQLRSQIERLRQLRSNGRVALELDPKARELAALPALPLEDGDRIVVPASPGFVAAMGSVNNENVFIHRSGKTVGEVVRAAGLTEDAEPDQAFLLRADGSIVARRDRGGFFGRGGFESIELMPGDTVVVPAMLDRESRYNFLIRAAKDWTQILANFGLGAAAFKTLGN
ncbi:MAG: SLBB domain-containing protein [Betaproteobacteria bacterium]